jgi:hypothetical protein
MTEALATIRSRYEATPRTLDTDLLRMARGDRGCLGDALAGVGGLAIIVFGVLASFGLLGWGFMSSGAVLLVAGFLMSAAATARSGPLRRKALIDGPLVLARVVQGDPALYEPGDAVLPARVVFAPTPAHRWDSALLRELGQRLQQLHRADTTPADQAAVAAVLRDANRVETVRLPPSLAGAEEAYIAVVAVDARRLPGRRLEDGELTLIVDPASGFAEHV